MTLIAHISDLHIRPRGEPAYGVSETNVLAERAIHALLRVDPAPDCLIITGDLTDCGLDEEYALLSELLARLPFPVFAIPGNHDRRDPFRQAFAAQGYLPVTGQLDFAVDVGGIRLIGLDTLVPGKSHGELAETSLPFLSRTLADARDTPTMVMIHHPPFATGIAHMDATRLSTGAEQLEHILAANRQVQRLLCGHIHRSIQRMFGGTIAQIAPSVGHQVAFDLRPGGPSSFVLDPPAFLLHRLDGTAIVSHHVMVDRAPGPFPFILPDDYPGR